MYMYKYIYIYIYIYIFIYIYIYILYKTVAYSTYILCRFCDVLTVGDSVSFVKA